MSFYISPPIIGGRQTFYKKQLVDASLNTYNAPSGNEKNWRYSHSELMKKVKEIDPEPLRQLRN
jgi:hypothetical protein